MKHSAAFFIILMASFVPNAWCLDKNALTTHLRKAFNLDSRTPIEIGEPQPSDFSDMRIVPVTLAGSGYQLYLSQDEKKYIWGQLFDVSADPDRARAAKIRLQNSHSKGSDKAPIVIVEFSDLQCPHCAKAHATLSEQLFKVYSDKQVRWVFKHFPLQGHDWAEKAAASAECASKQNEKAFWGMMDLFYKNASTTDAKNIDDKVKEYSTELKLNHAQLKTCSETPEVIERVKADKNEGLAAGVSSTPSIFVNGRMKRGFKDFDDLRALIDDKFREAGLEVPKPATGK